MNLLDENIPAGQRAQLERWGVRVRQIGQEVGRLGMHDDEIITLILGMRRVTLFTRDRDFSHARLAHPAFCLVRLDCSQGQAADFVRRILRHPLLRTQDQRMGLVVRASHEGLRVWRRNADEQQLLWPSR